MIHPVWRQMALTLLWAGFLGLQFILSEAEDVKDVHHSPVLHRQKREWRFNILLAFEEIPPQNLPQLIGQLLNTRAGANTQFKISGEGVDGVNDLFTVNKAGEIFVMATLDREKKSSYKLKAHIFNTITKRPLDDDIEFTVKVQDVNDHAPVFSETYTGSIRERSRQGAAVLTVTATDADDPTSPNGNINYELLNGTEYFSIKSTTGEITVQDNKLDRETQSQYKLVVKASDLPGLPGGLSTTTTVTININDINDNMATFKKETFSFSVRENENPQFTVGTLPVEDRDEKQHKNPRFTVQNFNDVFYVEPDDQNDGALKLRKSLDYETTSTYSFKVVVTEDGVAQPPDNQGSMLTTVQVHITVIDVDEPPVFSKAEYTFDVQEGPIRNKVIGSVSARDPDKANYRMKYSIRGLNCPLEIDENTGQLALKKELDRETEATHLCDVTAQEISPSGLKGYTIVKIKVLDINDNQPELTNTSTIYICDNDKNGTIIGTIGATDKDENPGPFRFILAKRSSNFSLHDNLNNTATIVLTHRDLSMDTIKENFLEIEISDGHQKSINKLDIRVCTCRKDRQIEYCKAYTQTGVSISALIAILLCIVTILVIVILFVLRKRYQKENLVTLGKPAGEIHEQLVTYDEEGGGEMDTNGYDVSILSSACHGSSLRPTPAPAVYAVAKKPPACKGDMAMMIEVKKDEADHDRDGIPYDTLHIYGYEGTESLAGSLSSLDSSSVASNLDYDFLSDWGPRFRTLAQLYGVDGSDSDSSY
ncbi:cadherin-5-like [Colossoma macropomum]|uniref:cadherin-5-like n=1 Tax=Colossoma macropomum TaxID=42526 RepID=UPI00186403CF|nr:cadherin-5-like [Colossoma macropomum]